MPYLMASNWFWYCKVWRKLSKPQGRLLGTNCLRHLVFLCVKTKKKKVGSDSTLISHYKIKTFPFGILFLTMTLSAIALTSSLFSDNVTSCQFLTAYKLPDTIISDNRSTFVSLMLWYLCSRIFSSVSPLHLICFNKRLE